MTKQRKRGGTFAALGKAASDILLPVGFFYAAKRQQSRVAKRRTHRQTRRR